MDGCILFAFMQLHFSAHLTTVYVRGELLLSTSVCLSVRPSVKRVDCDKTRLSSVSISTPYDRAMFLVS